MRDHRWVTGCLVPGTYQYVVVLSSNINTKRCHLRLRPLVVKREWSEHSSSRASTVPDYTSYEAGGVGRYFFSRARKRLLKGGLTLNEGGIR